MPERKDGPARLIWPIVSGRYIVGNPERSVAVCTLASSDLVDHIGARDEIAIVGRLFTLNLGLEKLVWNVVSNPAIRFLILCGDDTSSPIWSGGAAKGWPRAGVRQPSGPPDDAFLTPLCAHDRMNRRRTADSSTRHPAGVKGVAGQREIVSE